MKKSWAVAPVPGGSSPVPLRLHVCNADIDVRIPGPTAQLIGGEQRTEEDSFEDMAETTALHPLSRVPAPVCTDALERKICR